MKKIFSILICILLVVLLALPAMAAAPDQVDGVEALSRAWNGYDAVPNYSGGYWIDDDGVLTVGLVDEAGKAEVLDIVGDAPVNFVMQSYSYNELMAVQNELTEHFEADVGLQTLGVYVMDNAVEVGINMGHPKAAAFAEEMGQRYGDKIFFTDMDGMAVLDTIGAAAGETEEEPTSSLEDTDTRIVVLVMVIIGVAVVAFGVVGMIVLARRDKQVPTYDFVTYNTLPEKDDESPAEGSSDGEK